MDRVRDMDFDTDEIEKGHSHYGLFLKRKSFAHEQELQVASLHRFAGRGPTASMTTARLCSTWRGRAGGPFAVLQ